MARLLLPLLLLSALLLVPAVWAAPTAPTGRITSSSPSILAEASVGGSGTYHVQGQIYRTDTWGLTHQQTRENQALPQEYRFDFGAGQPDVEYEYQVRVYDLGWRTVVYSRLGRFVCCAGTPTTGPTPTVGPTPTPAPPSLACGGVERYREVRPENTPKNAVAGRRPSGQQFAAINMDPNFRPFYDRVNGQGCLGGTTEQLLEFYARKHGLPHADLLKAHAVAESFWRQSQRGDCYGGSHHWLDGFGPTNCHSYGILQVRIRSEDSKGWPDVEPDNWLSTNFNADYAGAIWAYHWSGQSWLRIGGDRWRVIRAYFCGCNESWGGAADRYADDVTRFLNERPWKSW